MFAVIAAESELRAVAKDDPPVVARPGLQFLDAVEVDQTGAVNAREFTRVELRGQVRQRFADQRRLFAEMDADVIAFGFDPVNSARRAKS